MRFKRDTRPPAPEVVVLSSPRHRIVRSDVIKSIALSGDGRIAAWTEFGATQMLRVWDVGGSDVKVKLEPTLTGGDTFEAVAFSPDNRTVAAGVSTGQVRSWDVETGYPRALLQGHKGEVVGVAL